MKWNKSRLFTLFLTLGILNSIEEVRLIDLIHREGPLIEPSLAGVFLFAPLAAWCAFRFFLKIEASNEFVMSCLFISVIGAFSTWAGSFYRPYVELGLIYFATPLATIPLLGLIRMTIFLWESKDKIEKRKGR